MTPTLESVVRHLARKLDGLESEVAELRELVADGIETRHMLARVVTTQTDLCTTAEISAANVQTIIARLDVQARQLGRLAVLPGKVAALEERTR